MNRKSLRDRKRAIMLMAVMCILPLLTVLVELQWHYTERIIGSYLESCNTDRDRLERFVQQEIQTGQALEDVNRLINIRAQENQRQQQDPEKKAQKPEIHSDVVKLDQGQKLIMTRARFQDIQKRLSLTFGEMPDMTNWTRTILIRSGWLQTGEAFFVDNGNFILYRMPLSAERFDQFDTYAVMNADIPFDDDVKRIYLSTRFFAMLRGLPTEIRDQIINPSQFLELETTAKRIGISDAKHRIYIERIISGQVGIIPIPLSAELLHQIDLALGEA